MKLMLTFYIMALATLLVPFADARASLTKSTDKSTKLRRGSKDSDDDENTKRTTVTEPVACVIEKKLYEDPTKEEYEFDEDLQQIVITEASLCFESTERFIMLNTSLHISYFIL